MLSVQYHSHTVLFLNIYVCFRHDFKRDTTKGQANNVFNETRIFEETLTSPICVRQITRSLVFESALAVLRFFMAFCSPSKQIPTWYLKNVQNRFPTRYWPMFLTVDASLLAASMCGQTLPNNAV
jgi:hypothetical protein